MKEDIKRLKFYLKVTTIYLSKYQNTKSNMKIVLNEIVDIINIIYNRFKYSHLIVGGDFNARVADQGEIDHERLPWMTFFTAERKSLDKKVDQRGLS